MDDHGSRAYTEFERVLERSQRLDRFLSHVSVAMRGLEVGVVVLSALYFGDHLLEWARRGFFVVGH